MRHRNDLDAIGSFTKNDQVRKSLEHCPAGLGLAQRITFRVLQDLTDHAIEFIQKRFRSLAAALGAPSHRRLGLIQGRRMDPDAVAGHLQLG